VGLVSDYWQLDLWACCQILAACLVCQLYLTSSLGVSNGGWFCNLGIRCKAA
jgi:hypothetical protein